MDATLEEAARVGGATTLRTAFKITLPLMISPMVLVLALQSLRVFQSFETEYLLGMPFGFYVYSTKIFTLIRNPIPNYGEATVLASITPPHDRIDHPVAALDPLHAGATRRSPAVSVPD